MLDQVLLSPALSYYEAKRKVPFREACPCDDYQEQASPLQDLNQVSTMATHIEAPPHTRSFEGQPQPGLRHPLSELHHRLPTGVRFAGDSASSVEEGLRDLECAVPKSRRVSGIQISAGPRCDPRSRIGPFAGRACISCQSLLSARRTESKELDISSGSVFLFYFPAKGLRFILPLPYVVGSFDMPARRVFAERCSSLRSQWAAGTRYHKILLF